MGAKISKEKIEKLSTRRLLKISSSTVKHLGPEARAVYDLRMSARQVSAEEMETYSDRKVEQFS